MKKWGWVWHIKIGGISLAMLCLLSTIEISVFSSLKAIASQKKKPGSVVIFQPPPEEGQPEETGGAASRNGKRCPGDVLIKAHRHRSKFKAIVPQTNSGLTTKEYPTFWADIPQTTAHYAVLSIAKADAKPHWHQAIALTGQAGVIEVKLDRNAPGLEIGQSYRWVLILVCNANPHPSDPVVTAGVKRINLPVNKNLLQNTAKLKQATWYAKKGIWYDALDILAREKSFLNNGEYLWVRYLRSGGISSDH